MRVSNYIKRGGRHARSGQTLVEYALIVSLISVVAMSALEEVGLHVKKAAVSASCAMVWAKYNVSSGGNAAVNQAWHEISQTIDQGFGNSSAEMKMKERLVYEQSQLAWKFGYTGPQ